MQGSRAICISSESCQVEGITRKARHTLGIFCSPKKLFQKSSEVLVDSFVHSMENTRYT